MDHLLGGQFFAEKDASWYHVIVRNTGFKHSYIVLFYGAFPVYIIAGISPFLYARTRLLQFADHIYSLYGNFEP